MVFADFLPSGASAAPVAVGALGGAGLVFVMAATHRGRRATVAYAVALLAAALPLDAGPGASPLVRYALVFGGFAAAALAAYLAVAARAARVRTRLGREGRLPPAGVPAAWHLQRVGLLLGAGGLVSAVVTLAAA